MNLKLILFVATIAFVQALPAQRVKRKGVIVTHSNPQTEQVAWYKIQDLKGYWKEVNRTDAADKNVPFTDTLLMKINGSNSLTKIMGSMGLDLKGAAMIEAPNFLNIAADRYTIIKADKNNLLLKNDNGTHNFIKINKFPEGINYEAPKTDDLKKVESVNVAQLQGDWEVYRRDAAPGFITDKTILVKSFTIADIKGKIAKGTINTYDGKNIIYPLLATYNFEEGKMEISMPGTTMNLSVFEADAGTMIFGKKDGVMNYARKK